MIIIIKKIKLIAIAALMLLSSLLYARTYSLEDCIYTALKNNAGLQQQELSLEKARLNSAYRWNVFLPTINLSAGTSYSNSLLAEQRESNSVSLGGAVSLSINPGTSSEQKSAILNYELSLLTLEQTQDTLIALVKDAFYQVLLVSRHLELLEENIALVQNQVDQSFVRYQNGYVTESSYLQSRLQLENARLSYSQEEAEYQLSRLNLQNLLGVELEKDSDFAGRISTEIYKIPAASSLYKYIANRIEIQSAAYSLELAKLSLSRTNANLYPNFSISGNWNLGGSFGTSSDIQDNFTLGISLNLPVSNWIPGSSSNLTIRSADLQVQSEEIEQASLRTSAEYEIQSLVSQLKQTETQIEIANLQLELAEKSYRLAEQGYASGMVEQLELQSLRANLMEARMNVVDSQYNYAARVIDLETALNLDNISLVLEKE